MSYDRSAILRNAWEIYRSTEYECERRALRRGFRANRARWSNALKSAWAAARQEARIAALTVAERTAELRAAAERRLLEALTCEPNLHYQSNIGAIVDAYRALDRLAA